MKPLDESYLTLQTASGIQIGDSVKILCRAESYTLGWHNSWESDMTAAIGKTQVIKAIMKNSGVLLDGWYYPFFVLEKVAKAPKVVKVRLNPLYEATISKDGIKIGGLTLTLSLIDKLEAAQKQLNK